MTARGVAGSPVLPNTREADETIRWEPWLHTYFMLKTFNCLPRAGGWFDQDWFHCDVLQTIHGKVLEIEDAKVHQR